VCTWEYSDDGLGVRGGGRWRDWVGVDGRRGGEQQDGGQKAQGEALAGQGGGQVMNVAVEHAGIVDGAPRKSRRWCRATWKDIVLQRAEHAVHERQYPHLSFKLDMLGAPNETDHIYSVRASLQSSASRGRESRCTQTRI
jgi:hypothetical protein